jgi:hypothetical protein
MRRVFRDFANSSRDADVAVVYYAGHGIEVEGTNYLIPIDASLEQDLDVYDEAFSLDRILVTIEPAKQLRLVILDACRNNPFAKAMKRTIGRAPLEWGWRVEPTSPEHADCLSEAGSTASDGAAKTARLRRRWSGTSRNRLRCARPSAVRDDILKNTSNKQSRMLRLGVTMCAGSAKLVVSERCTTLKRMFAATELALQVGTKRFGTLSSPTIHRDSTELAEAARQVIAELA